MDACFVVRDAEGTALAYAYFSDQPIAGTGAKLSRDEARRVAANIAKIPDGVRVQLDEDERAALRKFIASRSELLTEAEAVRLLLRDALIGIGDLPLGRQNRSRWAGRRK